MKWGIDISKYQINLNPTQWKIMRDNGCSFVIIRAGNGYITDPALGKHVSSADTVGIPYGFYWWCDPTLPIAGQVKAFTAQAGIYHPTCMVGDFEQWWSDWQAWTNHNKDATVKVPVVAPDILDVFYEKFLIEMSEYTLPFVSYTGKWFVDQYSPKMKEWLGSKYQWYAHYRVKNRTATWAEFPSILAGLTNPFTPTGTWDIWQFTSSLALPGLPAHFDLNIIRDDSVYERLFGAVVIPPPLTLEERVAILEKKAHTHT